MMPRPSPCCQPYILLVGDIVAARVALPADAGTQGNVLKPRKNTEDWRVSSPWDMLMRP